MNMCFLPCQTDNKFFMEDTNSFHEDKSRNYLQSHRKLAVIRGHVKFLFSKLKYDKESYFSVWAY